MIEQIKRNKPLGQRTGKQDNTIKKNMEYGLCGKATIGIVVLLFQIFYV